MATTFDSLAGMRPRVRRDVLFTQTPGGVLFHNADGGFHLVGRTAYRFASLLVPHLDGSRTLSEICEGFGEPQRAMVAELVGSLVQRDFARDVPPQAEPGPPAEVAARFAAQIAYVDHYVNEAPARFARFRATRVAVLGEGETAEWCVLALVRNGCAEIAMETAAPRAEEEARALAEAGCPVRLSRLPGPSGPSGRPVPAAGSVSPAGGAAEPAGDGDRDRDGDGDGDEPQVLVVTGADAAARAHRLLDAGLRPGQLLIPAWTFGERVVVGPRSDADSAGCLRCALLRLGDTTDAARAAELWSELAGGARPAPTPPGGALAGPVAAMIGNLLAYEIFRTVTGALPAETDGQVLIQDLDSLDVVAEPLHPHPRCGRCAARDEAHAPPRELTVARTATVESARDAEAVVAELNRISGALVRPHTGVFTGYDDETLTQTPLKVTRVEVPLGAAGTRRIAAFDVHHLAGARQRGLRAAAVAYVEHAVPARTVPEVPDGLPALLPGALTAGGGTGAGAERVTRWAVATSLLTKEQVAVPAGAARPLGALNRDRLVLAGSWGAGCGETPGEAAGHALLSALAHDALLRALRGAAAVRALPLDGGPELVFLARSATTLGVAVELLTLGEAGPGPGPGADGEGERWPVPVVLAREQAAAGAAGRWAVGCELTREAAAVAALRELLGQVQLAAETGEAPDTGDPLVPDLAPETLAVSGPAAAGAEPAEPAEPVGGLATVLERLRAAGRDVLHLDTTPADLRSAGLHTARVLLTEGDTGGDR